MLAVARGGVVPRPLAGSPTGKEHSPRRPGYPRPRAFLVTQVTENVEFTGFSGLVTVTKNFLTLIRSKKLFLLRTSFRILKYPLVTW